MAAEVVIDIVGKDSFSGTLGNFGNIMTGIHSAVNLVGDAFRAFTGLAMEGLEAVASYERMGVSFEALAASQMLMSGAAEDMNEAYAMTAGIAEELLDWSQQLAINSPFTQEGVAEALRMAMAYGFNTEEAQRLTEAMIDYTSASGQSEHAMSRIALALGQISATGKVTGQDILQLTNVGVPAMQILADHFGVTTAEIIKMRADGLLPAEESIEAITVWMETNFAGAAASFAESWAGLMGTFEDLKAMGLREFFGEMLEALQPLAVEFAEWLQGPGMERIAEWGQVLGQFTADVIEKIPQIIESIQPLISVFQNGFTAFNASGFLAGLDVFFASLFDTMAAYIDTWATGSGPDELSDRIVTFIENIGTGGEIDSKALQAMQNVLAALVRAAGRLDWSAIGQAIDTGFAEWSQEAGQGLDQWIANALSGNNESLNAIDEWFYNLSITAGQALDDWDDQIIAGIRDGIVNGLNQLDINAQKWVDDHIINPIKRALGIASPSSVFMQIGRDIVQGLMNGISFMGNSLITVFEGIIDRILQLPGFRQVAEFLGVEVGGGTGSTGGIDTSGSGWSDRGGGTGTTGTGGVLSTAGGVVNNFYGNVYFGDMGQLGYECPSPHPLMAASANSVLNLNVG
jgi:tape measure domain-containing protein